MHVGAHTYFLVSKGITSDLTWKGTRDVIMWYVISVKQRMKKVWVEIEDQGEWEFDIGNLYQCGNLGKCDSWLILYL